MSFTLISQDTIIDSAASMLVLSLTTIEHLSEDEQLKKTQLIHARNRVFVALKKSPALEKKVVKIEGFYEEIGGSSERDIVELSWKDFIQKKIEGEIVKSILNPDPSKNHLRAKIIQQARDTATPEVKKRLDALLTLTC